MSALHEVVLTLFEQRSVEAILLQVTEHLARALRPDDGVAGPLTADDALVRIWFVEPGDKCVRCNHRMTCPGQIECLHLVASAGKLKNPKKDWLRLDILNGTAEGSSRVPIGINNIGMIAKTGISIATDMMAPEPGHGGLPKWAAEEGVVSFTGHALVFRERVLGVLAVFSRRRLPDEVNHWLGISANHVAAAIANARAFEDFERLKARLEEENDQLREEFRDLFDEAPIAYVHEGMDSRFIRANRAAMKTLGIKPEDVPTTYGKSFVPDATDAQQRMREALESIGRGADTSGIVLEMRRKDNGEPFWIQWWSRPDPRGNYTRTMFLDITDRVLLEQEQARLQEQNEHLLEEIRSVQNFGDIIGESPGLRKVIRKIQLVAPTDAAVLINGESGTGKELVARAIHDNSPRKGRALIKVNCGAIPNNLFESEFFGHMRGAFTGAVRDKPGRFELADGGTLFLDEIGEIPLAVQAKLLRVLQEQEIERVGDTRTRKINVRIIAATNRDLKTEVDAGRFRQDLFYRLVVFPLEIPPLRERREDIAPLAARFVRVVAKRMNRPAPHFTKAQAEQLAAYDWPGNVRELQNVVERAVILAQGGTLLFDLQSSPHPTSPAAQQSTGCAPILSRFELKQRERESIVAALAQTGGKIFSPDGAAALLGMKPTTLASRIKALGIQRK